jgi:outer membrane receptor protein involved in Fe transport
MVMRSSTMRMPGLLLSGCAIFLFSASAFAQDDPKEEPEQAAPQEEAADEPVLPATGPTEEEAAELGKVTVTGSHIRRAQIEGPQPIQVFTPDMVRNVGGVKLGDYLNYLPVNQMSTDSRGNLMDPFKPAGASFFNLRGLGWETTLTLVNGRRAASFAAYGVGSFVNINAIPLAAIERVEILKDGASAIYGSDAIAGAVNIIMRDDYEGFDLSASYSGTEEGGAEETSLELIGGHNFGRTNVTAVLSWYEQEPLFARERESTATVDQRWRGGYDGRSAFSTPPNLILFDDYQAGVWNMQPDPACPEDAISYVEWAESDLCHYNYNRTAQLSPGNERWAAQASVVSELAPALQLRATAAYHNDKARREYAPAPVYWWPYIPVDHPDNPFDQSLLLQARLTQTGNRKPTTETDGRHFDLEMTGLAGTWQWTGYASWSDSESDYVARGLVEDGRLDAALMGMGGENGDQWFNPFGSGSANDPELLAWLQVPEIAKFRTRERTVGAFADGPIFDLPSGELGAAVGLEYRDQGEWQDWIQFRADFDDLATHRQVRSGFVEFNVPILYTLEAQLAARYEDYSDFGSHTSPKLALAWRPGNTLLVRASYGESFRAPYFYQLFAPPVEGEDQGIEDSLRCPVTGDARDCQGIFRVEYSGNPDLGPETGESWYAGIVWSPEAVRGLDLEIDFWRLTYDDRIYDINSQYIIDAYPDNPDWVQRADPTPEDAALGIPGVIELIYQRPVNIAKTETQGIDFAARYAWAMDNLGLFNAQIAGTYLDEFRETDPTSSAWEFNGVDLAGTAHWGWTGQPRWRLVSSLDWSRGQNSASAVVRFMGSYEDASNWPDENGAESDRPHRVGSWTSIDLQYGRTFRALGDGHLSVGCANCADRDPPLFLTSPVDRGVHSILGRTWFARWSQPFGDARRERR